MAFITSTDLWGDAEGLVVENCVPVPFFLISDSETGNVTIDGVRASGIDAYKLVYADGMKDSEYGYTPTVRLAVSGAAFAEPRKVVGVTAHPAQVGDKVAVYNSGVVKVTLFSPTGMESNTVQAGKLLVPASDGDPKSAPDLREGTGGLSYIDQIVGKAYQSAASGDEFLMKLML